MSFWDTLQGEDITGTRQSGTSAKARIKGSIERQIEVESGKKVVVANQEVKSWWNDGVAKWKISNFTLRTFSCSKEQHLNNLKTALSVIDSGGMDDVIQDLEERLKEKQRREINFLHCKR